MPYANRLTVGAMAMVADEERPVWIKDQSIPKPGRRSPFATAHGFSGARHSDPVDRGRRQLGL